MLFLILRATPAYMEIPRQSASNQFMHVRTHREKKFPKKKEEKKNKQIRIIGIIRSTRQAKRIRQQPLQFLINKFKCETKPSTTAKHKSSAGKIIWRKIAGECYHFGILVCCCCCCLFGCSYGCCCRAIFINVNLACI